MLYVSDLFLSTLCFVLPVCIGSFCQTLFTYFLVLPVLDLYVPSPASALLVGL